MPGVERRRFEVLTSDGAASTLQIHVPALPRALMYWMPALGVGLRPNEAFADAMAEAGVATAIHEWRGLGSSNRRATRRCNWGYRELLEIDLPAGLDAAQREFRHLPLWLGGHSLGGQFALMEASRERRRAEGVLLVATSQPDWRRFPGIHKHAVLAFARIIPCITWLVGHFPGRRLGFAGREARSVMNDWAATCARGDYEIPALGQTAQAMAGYQGRVVAVCLPEDRFAPKPGSRRLLDLASRADWRLVDLERRSFVQHRADHFGWLRESRAVVDALIAGMGEPDPLARRAQRLLTAAP